MSRLVLRIFGMSLRGETKYRVASYSDGGAPAPSPDEKWYTEAILNEIAKDRLGSFSITEPVAWELSDVDDIPRTTEIVNPRVVKALAAGRTCDQWGVKWRLMYPELAASVQGYVAKPKVECGFEAHYPTKVSGESAMDIVRRMSSDGLRGRSVW